MKDIRFTIIFALILSLFSCEQSKELAEKVLDIPPEARAPIRLTPTEMRWATQDLVDFYQEKGNVTLWNANKKREELLEALITAENDGLRPDSYPIPELFNYHLGYYSLNADKRTEADLLYTQTFLKLAKHLATGRLNPKKLYGDWEYYKKDIDYQSLLTDALAEKSVKETLAEITPQNKYYIGLKEAYADYKQKISKDTVRPIRASEQEKVAYQLALLGDYARNDKQEISAEELSKAIANFQKRNELSPSGRLDESTLKALNLPIVELTKKIIVNLERARWIPNDLGDKYVLVNIPEAHLYLVNDGEIIEEHTVIVGTAERRTPVLSSHFSQLVINPTWPVPPTILKNDLTPKASQDSTYFARNNMLIYNNKGEQINPEEWDPEQSKHYRYVQQPGGANSLGLIKFDFPNQHMVYLHDTNNKALFGRKNRALSSGCVRVQDPFDLADNILKLENNPKTKEDLLALVEEKKTKFLPLKRQVFVHQLYWTTWKDNQGQLQFRNDPYDFDAGLYKRL